MTQVIGIIGAAPEAVGTGCEGLTTTRLDSSERTAAVNQSRPPNRYTRTSGGNLRRAFRPNPSRLRSVRAQVMRRDDFTCQGCGVRAEAPEDYNGRYAPTISLGFWMELDHIVRYRDGGEFTVDNLRAMCPRCNAKRG